MTLRIERRLAPATSLRAILLSNAVAVAAALIAGGLLFLPFHISPFSAYADLVGEAFFEPARSWLHADRGDAAHPGRIGNHLRVAYGLCLSRFPGLPGGRRNRRRLARPASGSGQAVRRHRARQLSADSTSRQLRCRMPVVGPGRFRARPLRRDRSPRLADDELCRRSARSIPGRRPHARARRSAADGANAPLDLAALHRRGTREPISASSSRWPAPRPSGSPSDTPLPATK